MNKTLAGVLVLAAIPNAEAAGLDLSLSNETAALVVLFNPRQASANGASELGLGGFVSEAGDNLLQASLLARGSRVSGNTLTTLGVGLKAVYGELEIDDEVRLEDEDEERVGALAIGVQGSLQLVSSRHTPIELVGEAFMAPGITSFTDAERYLEIGVRLEVDVIPQAKTYVGYRRLSFDTNDYDDVQLDSGFHVGLRVNF